jgi:hypothetical protein
MSELEHDEELTAAQALAQLKGLELPREPEAKPEDQPVPEGFPYLPVTAPGERERSKE